MPVRVKPLYAFKSSAAHSNVCTARQVGLVTAVAVRVQAQAIAVGQVQGVVGTVEGQEAMVLAASAEQRVVLVGTAVAVLVVMVVAVQVVVGLQAMVAAVLELAGAAVASVAAHMALALVGVHLLVTTHTAEHSESLVLRKYERSCGPLLGTHAQRHIIG